MLSRDHTHAPDRATERADAIRAALFLIRNFRRDESGALVLFSVFLLVGILMVGGLAVDLMRTETARAKLQSTADTAVLAAASSTQERDPATVVADYFAAAGLSEALTGVTVDGVFTAREVTATSSERVNASFLRLAGIESFEAAASATASEKITAVEVSLVLDISGSMNGSKLQELQDASAEFVNAVFGSVPTSESMITIVPYAAQVAAGADILRQLNVTDEHQYSHCVEFDEEHFDQVAFSTTDELRRAAHFDPYTSYQWDDDARSFVCPTEDFATILPYSNDPQALIDKIYSLRAGGNTGIDNGMKWGAALLDSSAQPIMSGLITDGVVSSEFAGRPHSLEEYPGIKAVVLMTDGQNTQESRLRTQYRDGLTDVWFNETDNRYSIQDEEYMDRGDWDGRAWEDFWYWRNGRFSNQPDGGWSKNRQLTYPELWNRFNVSYHAYMRYDVNNWASQYYAWDDEPYYQIWGSEKDNRLLDICEATKAQGIVVYTIGVETSWHSNNLLSQCATSPAHHFDVDRFDLSRAFGAIITSINHLRLTQ